MAKWLVGQEAALVTKSARRNPIMKRRRRRGGWREQQRLALTLLIVHFARRPRSADTVSHAKNAHPLLERAFIQNFSIDEEPRDERESPASLVISVEPKTPLSESIT